MEGRSIVSERDGLREREREREREKVRERGLEKSKIV